MISNNYRKTRFFIGWSLVFYFLFAGCSEKKDPASVSIQWEGEKAVGIVVPETLLPSVSRDSLSELLQIRLSNSHLPVIGEYIFNDNEILFKPIIALTRGLRYNVFVRNKLVGELEIPNRGTRTAPEIVTVYPAGDTLPENLLKFYIVFSKPMQEGDVLQHIHLIKEGHDTLSSVFLDMELWNKERSIMTLWLDPGRIKRDLQPNQLLGAPLTAGSKYQLVIDKNWQDAEGILLKENFTKNFFAGPHDSISPDENKWAIDAPEAGTKGQLTISFHESLDHLLAENVMAITDINGSEIKGKFSVNDSATVVYFTPAIEWSKGNYTLQVESRLEDLAGNNLDRLFDADLTQKQQTSKKVHKRTFVIK